jgi:type IV secretory pathway VirJ component
MNIKFRFTVVIALLFIPISGGDYPDDFKNIVPPDKVFIYNQKDQPKNTNIEGIKKFPLVITNPKNQNKNMPVALLLSGDGGWFGFEQSIADNLAILGIPTIGLDSRKYFWNRRSPEETVIDMTGILNFYFKEWERDKVLIIGYSLGSEIVPFIVTRLPAEMKSKIASAVLLSPETFTDFEIHISNMLGMGNSQNIYNVTDEIIKMQDFNTIIIYGEGEKSKMPELLNGRAPKIIKIPGDHHYKFNLPLIIQTMKDNNAF